MNKAADLVLMVFATPRLAQDAEEEVMAVVNSVFEGMAINYGHMITDAFTEDAQTFTVFTDESGIAKKQEGSVVKFAEAVSKEKEVGGSEPIWNEKVNIDGPLASVWVDYAFYLGDEFHHCGVDAFHMINTPQGWKIFHLVDTRRVEDCQVPSEISDQYKN